MPSEDTSRVKTRKEKTDDLLLFVTIWVVMITVAFQTYKNSEYFNTLFDSALVHNKAISVLLDTAPRQMGTPVTEPETKHYDI